MLALNILAVVCASVLGVLGWSQYSSGASSLGRVILFVLSGALLPYVFALSWAILIVPPGPTSLLTSLRGLIRDRRIGRSE